MSYKAILKTSKFWWNNVFCPPCWVLKNTVVLLKGWSYGMGSNVLQYTNIFCWSCLTNWQCAYWNVNFCCTVCAEPNFFCLLCCGLNCVSDVCKIMFIWCSQPHSIIMWMYKMTWHVKAQWNKNVMYVTNSNLRCYHTAVIMTMYLPKMTTHYQKTMKGVKTMVNN